MNEETKQVIDVIMEVGKTLKEEIQEVKQRLDKVEQRLDKVEIKIDSMSQDITSMRLKSDTVEDTLISHTYDIRRLKEAQ